MPTGLDSIIPMWQEDGSGNGPWITTVSGRRFYFLNPTPDSIRIQDIASSLSKQCRFAGHTRKFYSIAEHSLYVSYLAINPLEGLLHDASEAFLVDMPTPIKREIKQYAELEDTIMGAIAKRFNIGWPVSDDTHDADKAQLIEEATHLVANAEWIHDPIYSSLKRKHGIIPSCFTPDEAFHKFMIRFTQLMEKHDDTNKTPF